MEPDPSWTSPSALADYTYCPRSHWYRLHPPPGGPAPSSERSALHGVRYHQRILTGERHRDERGGAYWGVLLLGLALAVGGIWWILRP
jgi:hypothetical protein